MMRSLFAGVAGLRSHQLRMDVVGNNVANVNTPGFKASRVLFHDIFSQTLRGASAPQGEFGGTNPQQIGLGMTLASVDPILAPGSLQFTGRQTDMAVEGEGYFVLRYGSQLLYTRAGAFDRDASGYLVNPANGARVQGWLARPDGTFDIKDQSTMGDIRVPTGAVVLAQPTSRVVLGQNLDAAAAVGTEHSTSVTVYDALGRPFNIKFLFKKTADNTWDWAVVDPLTPGPPPSYLGSGPAGGPYTVSGSSYAPATGRLLFNNDGTLKDNDGVATNDVTGSFSFTPPGTNPVTVTVRFTPVTQAASPTGGSTLVVLERDGYTMGSLESFAVDSTGVISGVYSNGVRRAIGQVALAVFPNPGGLAKAGNNGYQPTANSGLAQIGPPAEGGRGRVSPANLEMSNVDLAAEFTTVITTQRGFQANSRVITASDEMLQDLTNLKR